MRWSGFYGKPQIVELGGTERCEWSTRLRNGGNGEEHDSPKSAPHHPFGSDTRLPKTFRFSARHPWWPGQPNTKGSEPGVQIVAGRGTVFVGPWAEKPKVFQAVPSPAPEGLRVREFAADWRGKLPLTERAALW
jgi:hypothetical protein